MIKERIIQILEIKGIAKENFYKKIGVTSANFRGEAKKRPLNSNAIANILSEIRDVNPEWLLTGKGTMFKNSTPISQNIVGNKNVQTASGNVNQVFNDNTNDKDTSSTINIIEELNELKAQVKVLNAALQEKDNFIKILLEQQNILINKLQ